MLTALEQALAAKDAAAVQQAIFDLGSLRADRSLDEIASDILRILKRPEMWTSELAGHVLNFFEFEAPHLPQSSKNECVAFLATYGDEFVDFHSVQVVGELRTGPYLKPVPEREPKRKPRHGRR